MCFELPDASLLGKTLCRRLFVLTAYFLVVFARFFLFICSWMYVLMGLSKAINQFELSAIACLWFIAYLQENGCNLVETLQPHLSLQDCRAKVSSRQRLSLLSLHTQSDTFLSCKQLLANTWLVDVYITTFWLLQPVLGLYEWLFEWWKLQNRVARVITKSPFDTSCNLLLAILKWGKLYCVFVAKNNPESCNYV